MRHWGILTVLALTAACGNDGLDAEKPTDPPSGIREFMLTNSGAGGIGNPPNPCLSGVKTTWTFSDNVAGYDGERDAMILKQFPDSQIPPQRNLCNAGDIGDGKEWQSLFRWDLTGQLPAGLTVCSAQIQFLLADPSRDEYYIFPLKRDWTWNYPTDQVTWNNATTTQAWQLPGAYGQNDRGFYFGIIPASTATYPLIVPVSIPASAVQTWLNDPAQNHGIIVSNTGAHDRLLINSHYDTTNKTMSPTLSFTTVGP
jgi:hypothetical protein